MTFLIPMLSSVVLSSSDCEWIVVREQSDLNEAVMEGYLLCVPAYYLSGMILFLCRITFFVHKVVRLSLKILKNIILVCKN